jgi:hypothetical protein
VCVCVCVYVCVYVCVCGCVCVVVWVWVCVCSREYVCGARAAGQFSFFILVFSELAMESPHHIHPCTILIAMQHGLLARQETR